MHVSTITFDSTSTQTKLQLVDSVLFLDHEYSSLVRALIVVLMLNTVMLGWLYGEMVKRVTKAMMVIGVFSAIRRLMPGMVVLGEPSHLSILGQHRVP